MAIESRNKRHVPHTITPLMTRLATGSIQYHRVKIIIIPATTTPAEVMGKHGLVLKGTRMLDASVNCRVEEWVKG